MRMFGRLAVLVIVGLYATSASAFDVERNGDGPKVSTEGPKAEVVSPGETLKTKPSEGTVVRIPGIGKIGVLPKLDFGLELLYGANKGGEEAEEPRLKTEEGDEGDFRIRGSIKHRF
jgi:hypothetical protein